MPSGDAFGRLGAIRRRLALGTAVTAVATAGSLWFSLGLGLIPFSTSMLTLALFLGLMALGKSLNTPTITSLISKEASEDNVGAVMGASQGLSGLGRMIGPTWGGALFAVYFGLPFVATAIIVAATVWIAVGLISKSA